MRITAAVATKAGQDFSLQDLVLGDPKPGEVLVRVEGVGICHTDLASRDQIIPVPLPAVLGHEASGVVERVGAGVVKVIPGDTVVLTYLSCGTCGQCRSGYSSYCEKFPALNFAGRRVDGTKGLRDETGEVSSHFFGQSSFATYALAAERNVVKVRKDAPLAKLGPLGCGVQTGAGAIMRSLACAPDSSLAIFGGGAVGLSAVLGAVLRGCATIVVVEPHASRRSLALTLGATHVIDPAAKPDLQTAIREIASSGFDYVLDTTGNAPTIEIALSCLRKRGLAGLVAAPPAPGATFPLRMGLFVQSGFTIKGIMEGDSDPERFIPELVDLHMSGRFPFDKMIRTYPLAEINGAVADLHAGLCVKAILTP